MANAYTPMPWVLEQFFNVGVPANGYRLFTYIAGSSTKQTTYQSGVVSGAVAHSNPIVLDSAGRPPAPIFLQATSYKFVLAPPGTDDPPSTTIWTADNIASVPPFNVDLDIAGTSGEALSVGQCCYLSDGSGSRTAGTWYRTDADFDYASTTPPFIGFCTTAAGSAGLATTVRRLGRITGLSGLTAGNKYYVSATAGDITSTAPSNPRRVGQADSTTTLVIGGEIEEPIKGFIPLYLTACRKVAANVVPAIAASGGVLASDTTPILQRVNGATDKMLRINWAATVVEEVTWDFPYPPDLDPENNLEVHLWAAMSGATNTPTIAVGYFEGVGDTNAGGNTASITGTSLAEYIVTITAANIGAQPNTAIISLTPAAHATDAIYVYGAWIEYVRKLKST